jgi:hypothetical protein
MHDDDSFPFVSAFWVLTFFSSFFFLFFQYKPEWTPSPSYSNCIEEVIPVPHNQRATDASGRILERHELHASAVELLIQRWSEPHDLICDLSMTSNEIAPQAVALSRRFLGVFDAENAESKNRCLERVRQFLPPTAGEFVPLVWRQGTVYANPLSAF